jgi:hypothetical protein
VALAATDAVANLVTAALAVGVAVAITAALLNAVRVTEPDGTAVMTVGVAVISPLNDVAVAEDAAVTTVVVAASGRSARSVADGLAVIVTEVAAVGRVTDPVTDIPAVVVSALVSTPVLVPVAVGVAVIDNDAVIATMRLSAPEGVTVMTVGTAAVSSS